ncbi:hypothetical protein [Diaphorobacter sp.]|uniref:hypothetical protein n=1 Tax=Diaphorobacter sp. TaxID=1934310 RepID=UPI00258B46AF|nr:hypothetical protein [Diaphorobacter sp.]
MARPKIRPRRIRVSRDDGTDAFIIRVSDSPSPCRTGDELLAWHEAWFCCWASVPDLLDEPGPFSLVVEECAVPVPTEIGWDDLACSTLMRATKEKRGLTIGQLGGYVLKYLRQCRTAAQASTPPRQHGDID